jgi:carbamate kinase
MKRISHTPEEAAARVYKQRTIHNWKKQFGVIVPIELFDEFKRNKKHYIKLFTLDAELVRRVVAAPIPEEFVAIKECKD